jgi:hypothetical protein
MDDKPASGMAKAVEEIGAPFYRDAIAPSAKPFGSALETIVRGINAALLPLRGFAWGVERLEEFVTSSVDPKLRMIPPDKRRPPNPNIITPALIAVRFTEEEPDVQEMFAKLIASSTDERVADRAHPAFVEIIKQLTSDEAKLLLAIGPGRRVPLLHMERHQYDEKGDHLGGYAVRKNLSRFGYTAGCKHPEQIATYINNLVRLGLLERLAVNTFYNDAEHLYREIENDPNVVTLKAVFEEQGKYRVIFIRSGTEIMPLGQDFYKVCVQPYEERAKPSATPSAPPL